MGALQKLEDQLAQLFKDLPAIPKSAKDWLVQYWPYIALVIGILQLVSAAILWTAITAATPYLDQANRFSQQLYGVGYAPVYSATDKMFFYIAIGLLVVNAVIFLLAYKPLTKKLKKGWDLLFLAALLEIVYGVAQIFMPGYGPGSFLMTAIATVLGLYLLFQIRDRYTTKNTQKKTK